MLRGVLPAVILADVAAITRPLVERAVRKDGLEADGFSIGTASWYGLWPLEMVLGLMKPFFERAIGEALLPTYSFVRCYPRGTQLLRHRDRPACEVSATLPISGSDDAPWPIHLGTSSEELTAENLVPGDALLYSGCELWHWREPLDADWRVQLFLHYVRRDGPYAEWELDKRGKLGDPPVVKQARS